MVPRIALAPPHDSLCLALWSEVSVSVTVMIPFSVKCLRRGSFADQVAVLQVSEAHKTAIDWISSVVSAEGISCDLEKTIGWALPQSCSSHSLTVWSPW